MKGSKRENKDNGRRSVGYPCLYSHMNVRTLECVQENVSHPGALTSISAFCYSTIQI